MKKLWNSPSGAAHVFTKSDNLTQSPLGLNKWRFRLSAGLSTFTDVGFMSVELIVTESTFSISAQIAGKYKSVVRKKEVVSI